MWRLALWWVTIFVSCMDAAVAAPLPSAGVFTYHNDVGRTGQNLNEVLLKPESVNSERFGKLFSRVVDGDVYAQPLYVAGLRIPGTGRPHDAVIVATEGDGVYAFDADGGAEPLWHVSLIDRQHGASEDASTVSAAVDLACG